MSRHRADTRKLKLFVKSCGKWIALLGLFFSIGAAVPYLLDLYGVAPAIVPETVIVPGVTIKGYKLGGLNYSGFSGIIAACGAEISAQEVSLQIVDEDAGTVILLSSYREMGIFPDKEKIWQEASAIGHSGRWLKKIWTKWQVNRKGCEVPLYLHLDQGQAEKTIQGLGQPWHTEAKDAGFSISAQETISITEANWGRSVNLPVVLAELERKVAEKPGEPLVLQLSFVSVRPKLTKSDIEEYHITGCMARFSTNFKPERVNRTKNIALAAASIHDYLLAPDEIFSFNQVVGPRTRERGYDEADIIMQNELVTGVGGGVCQVSSTLYNAALLANLEILERHNHSMLITYVPPGLDATVSYGSLDLKFKNNSGGHLFIRCTAIDNSLAVKIFGWAKKTERITFKSEIEREIEPQTIYREDSTVPQGEYRLERHGIPGYVVKVERSVYDEKGNLLHSELLYRDYYPPVDRIIKTLFLSNFDNL